MMGDDVAVLRTIYARFNDRDLDGALSLLDRDVRWANGMDGGYEHGADAVREYWTRQWSVVDPMVEPLSILRNPEGEIEVEVRQTLYDLDGKLLEAQDGLNTQIVRHLFAMREGKVVRFDIRK